MRGGPVAGRYAAALYDIASEKKNMVDKVESELKAIKGVIEDNPDLQRLLYHPQITPAAKKDLLEKLFKGKISDVTSNFLALLVDRRRETYLLDIMAEFIALANAGRNIITAQVTTAVELNDQEKGELNRVLARLTGKKIQASYDVDPSLIGGVVVRMGDKFIDGSIKTKLAALKERLKAIS
ncbi:MAG TPA: F0F1 ATP synthase subunit delta [Bacillota bacterium]|jgi:F-type H+-transporting ATPase subunit delta|nr:F0F1 ATP synthase subunit delta [Peptococcaceae bacterium MAG4]NLW37646.1 F0F1 ATP synthase subunit delta [Peptococcaceae bacterium]HPZ42713.1 F0F1 ATP synthase subunit delta [Bacillota bacterium]HQD76236.1 F0F1 ATP synthase subunit delta [Bacillota bacterium]HUM58779.1 F0F1 ATP synthase subunit delta [Bacillota bacterium]